MDLAHLQIAPAAQFLCDIGGNISRPSLSGVEGHDADGVRILPVEQVPDDGLEIRGLDIGFAVGPDPAGRNRLPRGRRPDRRCWARSKVSNSSYASHYSNETSGEQLSAARGEFHISPGFVPHHPTFVDRPLDTVAELLCRAAGL
jgi:hypothetical protein